MDHDMNNSQSCDIPSTSDDISFSEDVNMEPVGAGTLHNDDNDTLPDLMEVSDSSDSSSDFGSAQSSAEELEVLQTVNSDQSVPSSSTSLESLRTASPFSTLPPFRPAGRSNNRRVRVEDDEDEERDRRHPSQRVSSPISDLSSNSSSTFQTPSPSPQPAQPQPSLRPSATRIRTTLNLPSLARMGLDQADPLRFFQHLMPQQPQTQQTEIIDAPTAGNDAPSAGPQPNTGAPSADSTPQAPQNQPPDNDTESEPETMALFTDILMRLGALGTLLGGSIGLEPETEDPERAKKLIDGLEEVPIGLVRRLARVGGTDDPDGGRDTMCAICWDQLLDEAGFGRKPAMDEDVSSSQSDASSSHATESEEWTEEPKQPKIVALPCAHVFHADCLIPWFSRPKQTTCPTCRFNIDPENLTRTRRLRRSNPMRPAQPNVATQGPQQPTQSTTGNADNVNAQPADQNNIPGGHFVFDGLPFMLATPPVISINVGGSPNNGNGGANQADGAQGIPHDIMEQIRARMEEQANGAGQGGQQPSPDDAATDTSPPTEPATPVGSPPPQPQPGLQSQSDNDHTTTHSIVFGIDVLVGGTIGPGGPRPEANTNEAAGNGAGRDTDENWFGMVMRDFQRDGAGAQTANNDNTGGNNTGQERAGEGHTQNGTDAPAGQGQGFPRFINMNMGNGESVHIASGMGRTMGEAMAQMLSSMANSSNQGPASTNVEAGRNPTQNSNANGGANEASSGPTDANRQTQNQQNPDAGTFAGMASFPFQMMAQMFGLSSPIRVRRRQNQGQDQPSNSDTPAASHPSPSAGGTSDNNTPPSGQGVGTPPRSNDNNVDNDDEGPFTRFIRNVMAGNVPMPDGATTGQNNNGGAPPHAQFFPPGFTIRTDTPSSTVPNVPQPPKRRWTPPPAPGPTLRQRIEKREREVGLRCCDMSCGVGPSDEDPSIALTEEVMKQLALKSVNVGGTMCPHTFHPSCLVSTERVALRGADAPTVGDDIEVSCSVCRAVGRVSKQDWEEGVQQLT